MIEEKPYRVLSLDGGGMRGLYTAVLLNGLASHYSIDGKKGQLDVGRGFDLISGTSTGGILGVGLAFGLSLNSIIDLYEHSGTSIFPRPMPTDGGEKWWAIKNLKRPAADARALRKKLDEVFGSTTLEQLFRERGISLCIPSVSVSDQKSLTFKTPHYDGLTRDPSFSLTDVCLATSAAPFFFPMHQMEHPLTAATLTFADGGLWANNPVLVSLIEALRITDCNRPIEIISVGTCAPPAGEIINEKGANRGIGDWRFGVKALELSLEAQSQGHNFMAELLCPFIKCECTIVRLPSDPPSSEQSRYLRMDNAAPEAISALKGLATHDVEKILGLIKAGNKDLALLDNIFHELPELED